MTHDARSSFTRYYHRMHANSGHVVVIGASGRVGSRLVEYSLEAGHRVTAAARHVDRLRGLMALPGAADRLEVRVVDVLDAASVADAVRDADIVFSALAAPSLEHPGQTLSQGMQHIVDALERQSPDARVLCIAGAGILPEGDGRLLLETAGFPEIYRAMSREHASAWDALRRSTLSWVVICPTDMPSGERTRQYRTAADALPAAGRAISAEDVADFMVREIVERRYDRVRVGIAR